MSLDDALASFSPETLSWRLVQILLGEVGAPDLVPAASVAEVARLLRPQATADRVAAAVALAASEPVDDVLYVAELLDAADRGHRVAFGRTPSLDVQADDAVLKALGLGWVAWRTGAGSVEARVERLLGTPSGVAWAAVWACVEVVLPLGGADLRHLFNEHGSNQANRLASLADPISLEGAQPALSALAMPLQAHVDALVPRAADLTEALAPLVPGLIASRVGAEEEVAHRADRMPLYQMLGARIAAEHAAQVVGQ